VAGPEGFRTRSRGYHLQIPHGVQQSMSSESTPVLSHAVENDELVHSVLPVDDTNSTHEVDYCR
jgi:hypothetical protein